MSSIFNKELLRNLVLYGMIGLFCALVVDYGLFTVLHMVVLPQVSTLIINCISVPVGITISFILNRRFNFKVTDRTAQRYIIFFVVGLCGLVLSNVIMFVGTTLSFGDMYVKLFSIPVVALFQFILNKTVSFRKTKAPADIKE